MTTFCMHRLLAILVFISFSLTLIGQNNELENLLMGKDSIVDHVLKNPEKFAVQLIYTTIDRNSDQTAIFKNYEFGVDPNRYFYPASTVKMPVAALALEKLNDLGVVGLDKSSEMITGAGRAVQHSCDSDASAQNNQPSIGHYIKKIFLYSDNQAYNRLFEFLGAAAINEGLKNKGIENSRIIHRVGAPGYNAEENKYINPVSFYDKDSLLYHRGLAYSSFDSPLQLSGELKGKGYMKNGRLVQEKMDFRQKNFLSLPALLGILQRIIYPEAFEAAERFRLSAEDRSFLLKAMATYPSESKYPKIEEPDGYVKFFMLGGNQKEASKDLRIFNKVGDAYGYLIDVAYIVDLKRNIEFILSGVIHVNENQIFNDDTYEYNDIGFPFFQAVGNIIYEKELSRSKSIESDLSELASLFVD